MNLGTYGETEKPKKKPRNQNKLFDFNNPIYNLTMDIKTFEQSGTPSAQVATSSGSEYCLPNNLQDSPDQKPQAGAIYDPVFEEQPEGSPYSKTDYFQLEDCESGSSPQQEDNIAEDLDSVDGENVYESIELPKENAMRPPPTPPPVEMLQDIKSKKRNCIINELISTEEDFLNGLVSATDDIMKPLIKQELPMGANSDILFGNIEEIRSFSEDFLRELKAEVLTENSSSQVISDTANIGKIFIDFIPRMKEVYTVYCRNHDDATAMLENIKDAPEFQQIIQECLRNVKNKMNVFDLGSVLIKPVQRVLKYPLLLHELWKHTENTQPLTTAYKDLVMALQLIQDVANSINEEKRRKDLVRKYRKTSQGTLSDKISKLSLHSVKKKSARMSLRLGHVTGLGITETSDKNFNEIEKRFKELEKTIKDFRQNCESYVMKYKEWLNSELIVYEDICDLFASYNTKALTKMSVAIKRIIDEHFRNFYDHLQLQVFSPLSSLLIRFGGPHSIICKRFDKLLDLERCIKSGDSKDKIQMAKNVYEALNLQLLEELPKLCDLSTMVFDRCVSIFIQLYRDFQENIVKEIQQVSELLHKENSFSIYVNNENLATLEEEFQRSLLESSDNISRYSIVPPSFGVVTFSSVRGSGRNDTRTHSEIVGIVKRQDPMGNPEKWLVDDGDNKGFVPSNALKQFTQSSTQLAHQPHHAESEYANLQSPEGATGVDGSSEEDVEGLEDELLDDEEYAEFGHQGRSHYRVEFDFHSRSTLELSVRTGEIVELLVPHDLEGNNDWWLMSNPQGQQGYVPHNYVVKAEYI